MMKIDNKGTHSFICFGGQDYWYHNKAHADIQVAKSFAKQGHVLYINSLVMQKVSIKKSSNLFKKIVRKSKSIFTGLKKVEENFWVYSPASLPIHHNKALRFLNNKFIALQIKIASRRCKIVNPFVMVVIPVAFPMLRMIKYRKAVYFKTDRYELFPNIDVNTVTYCDQMLKAESDLTVFVSKKLYDDECEGCKNPIYLDHGVDFKMFSTPPKDSEIPEDIKNIKRPIIGYFGTIDSHTVDILFLVEVAKSLPKYSFVFIGPKAKDYDELFSLENVFYIGKKPYYEIPYYGHMFDVSVMAWQKTEWIEACNPIKLKEYLAIGNPVVSTFFPELENYKNLISIANEPKEFAENIKNALEEDNVQLRPDKQKRVQNETWLAKSQSIIDILTNC